MHKNYQCLSLEESKWVSAVLIDPLILLQLEVIISNILILKYEIV